VVDVASAVKTFNKMGIDPISRAIGIEPKGLAGDVTSALGLGLPQQGIIASPAVTSPPVMPVPDDDAAKNAKRRSVLRQRRRSGRQSTILSDPTSGDTLG
jgi:hypothetical protein